MRAPAGNQNKKLHLFAPCFLAPRLCCFVFVSVVCCCLCLRCLPRPGFLHHICLHRARPCYQGPLARPRFTSHKPSAALERAKALTLTRRASGTSEFVARTSAHAARPKVARISPIFAAEASQHILAGRRSFSNTPSVAPPASADAPRRSRDQNHTVGLVTTSASQLACASRATNRRSTPTFLQLKARYFAPSSETRAATLPVPRGMAPNVRPHEGPEAWIRSVRRSTCFRWFRTHRVPSSRFIVVGNPLTEKKRRHRDRRE
jgi:hypothetical protein